MKNNFKYAFSVLVICIAQFAQATPDNSKWFKVNFIGVSGDSYFYYLTVEDLGFNSYYRSNSEYYLIRQNRESAAIESKVLLRKLRTDCDSETYECKQTTLFKHSTNLIDILDNQNVRFLFPNHDNTKHNFHIDDKGLYHINEEGERIDVVDFVYLMKFMPNVDDWVDSSFGKITYIQGYWDRGYSYLLFTYGIGGDIDLYQAIVPIKNL